MKTIQFIKDKLLDLGADDVIVSESEVSANQIKFANSKVAKTGSEDIKEISIFFVKNQRLLSTSVKDISKDRLEPYLKKIVSYSSSLPKNENYKGIAKGNFSYKDGVCDESVLDPEKQVKIITESIKKSSEHVPRCGGVLECYAIKTNLVSSNGIETSSKNSKVYFSIRSLFDKFASSHQVACGNSFKDLNHLKKAEIAGKLAKSVKNPTNIDAGKYDVIFSPLSFANILDNTADAMSIFNVEAGISFLGDKIKKQVASEKVSLIDNPTIPGFGFSAFDDEGRPTQKNVLIKNGVFKTFLHNTSSAIRYDVEPTASAGIINPSARNLFFDCSNTRKDLGDGLYVTNVWYTRFQNYATGDFSTILRDAAYLKKGDSITPVNGLRISENMLNILKNVVAKGKDTQTIYGWEVSTPTTTPSVLVKDVNITKAKD